MTAVGNEGSRALLSAQVVEDESQSLRRIVSEARGGEKKANKDGCRHGSRQRQLQKAVEEGSREAKYPRWVFDRWVHGSF
jgi:hypothetical protein